MPRETYTPGSNAPQAVIGRYWTRVNYWDGQEVFDLAHATEAEAAAHAQKASIGLRADVDVMDGAAVVATYRQGVTL